MRRPPRPPSESVLTRNTGLQILSQGLLIAVTSLVVFGWVYQGNPENLADARASAFCVMAYSQLAFALACRSEHWTWPQLGFWTNPALFAAVALSALLQSLVVWLPFTHEVFEMTDYPGQFWVLIIGASLLPVTVVELVKLGMQYFASGPRTNAAA